MDNPEYRTGNTWIHGTYGGDDGEGIGSDIDGKDGDVPIMITITMTTRPMPTTTTTKMTRVHCSKIYSI